MRWSQGSLLRPEWAMSVRTVFWSYSGARYAHGVHRTMDGTSTAPPEHNRFYEQFDSAYAITCASSQLSLAQSDVTVRTSFQPFCGAVLVSQSTVSGVAKPCAIHSLGFVYDWAREYGYHRVRKGVRPGVQVLEWT